MSDIQNEEEIIDLDNLFRVKVAVDGCNNDINKYIKRNFLKLEKMMQKKIWT